MPLKEGQWLFPPKGKMSWGRALSSHLVIASVFMTSKFWIQILNKINVYNIKNFRQATEQRPKDRGLLTVSNHSSCLDDPLMMAKMMKWRQAFNLDSFVWTSAANDVAFGKAQFWNWFFSLGKVFPIVRGDGVYQKGMDFMVEQLDRGKWCFIFPEGKINVTHEPMRLKWGVGRLIADCKTTPIVLPIYHVGMDDILPNRSPYIPQAGKRVTVLVGEPIDFTKDVQSLKALQSTPREMRKYFTDRIQEKFQVLNKEAEGLHHHGTDL